MRQALTTLTIRTPGQGLVEITEAVLAWTRAEGGADGLLTLFCQHTSASLLIQENAAAGVRADLESFFQALAPEEKGRYRHDEEGPDDMPGHIRAALTATSLGVPVIAGRPALGRWQGIYLFEHRRRPHDRQIVLHLLSH